MSPDSHLAIRMAAHDLRDPLHLVAGSLDLLARKMEGRLDPKERDLLSLAQDGTAQMERLLRDLSGSTSNPRAADGSAALDQALRVLSPLCEERGAVVTHGALPMLAIEEGALVKILIGNALRHAGPTPRIDVSAQRDPAGWRILVRDHGPGLDAAARSGKIRQLRAFSACAGDRRPKISM